MILTNLSVLITVSSQSLLTTWDGVEWKIFFMLGNFVHDKQYTLSPNIKIDLFSLRELCRRLNIASLTPL